MTIEGRLMIMKLILFILLIVFICITVIYLFSIKPRLFDRPDYTPFRGRMYAHRGLHNMNRDNSFVADGAYPENSLAAIKKAVDNGFGIEFDVHLTKDHIPVVFHDDTLDRICGVTGYLKDYTYEELQQFHLLGTEERIPAFSDVLKLVNGKVPLIIEYKVEKNANQLCSICNGMLADYPGLYCIESFHPQAVRWYRKHRPDIVRGQLSEDFTKQKLNIPYFLFSHLIGNCYGAPDFVAYNCKHHTELSRTICRKLYHCLSYAWTVRSQEELEHISPHFDSYIFEDFIPENI